MTQENTPAAKLPETVQPEKTPTAQLQAEPTAAGKPVQAETAQETPRPQAEAINAQPQPWAAQGAPQGEAAGTADKPQTPPQEAQPSQEEQPPKRRGFGALDEAITRQKERLYKKQHIPVRVLDIIIGVCIAAIVIVIIVGMLNRA